MTTQIGLFAKHWTPGATKTRLADSIGSELAANCSKEFLKTTLRRLSNIRASRLSHLLAFAPAEKQSEFFELLVGLAFEWQVTPQSAGDLGEKMTRYFEQAFASGHESAFLLGSDSPDFPMQAVETGLNWLDESSVNHHGKLVLGPATDGGYWCIGAKGVVPPIFEQMPWSQPNLLECTLKQLDQLGWHNGTDYLLLDEWYDVDTMEDLQSLQCRINNARLRKTDPLLLLHDWIDRSVFSS